MEAATPPAEDDTEGWRQRLIDYYTQNAPEKVRLVDDKMMAKFAGRYETLWANLIAKYGPLGQPIPVQSVQKMLVAKKKKGPGGPPSDSSRRSVADWHDEFAALVERELPDGPLGAKRTLFAVTAALTVAVWPLHSLIDALRRYSTP